MQRPTSVTVFGILNIVFAAFGVFGLIFSMALFHLPADSNNPVVKLIHENPAYAAWLKASILLGVPSCLVLLAAGMGLLCLKSWARILSITYAIYAIVFGMVGTVVNFILMVVPMAGTSPAATRAGSRRRHWRGNRRNHRRVFRPDLSRPPAHLYDPTEGGGGIPSACSVPDVKRFPRPENSVCFTP